MIPVFTFLASFCLALTLGSSLAWAQAPKREFRAAWIATVSNIDWPSARNLSPEDQRQEFIARLDQLQSLGANAVIVQIRPACDAFYASPWEPWSRYLTGKQGKAPEPFYDPLSFMIQEAHARNMEFHAWFNPYRALTSSKYNPNPPDHVTRKHPDWLISYGGKTQLDPGLPEVRDYVARIIMDVVQRYDIDAVHMDDYFYPYRIAGQEFGDEKTYQKYKGQFLDKASWRRHNVNLFVEDLSRQIRRTKPHVKLGISPFGVWRNASKDPMGSETRAGQTNYDDLYADVLLWMRKGWVDYLLPQLYWERGHRAADFNVLLPWWEQHRYDRHIYYGLGLYRMINASRPPWNQPKEILSQIRAIRQYPSSGFALYSLSNLDRIPPYVTDSLRQINRRIAFPPTMKWIDSIPPAAPQVSAQMRPEGIRLEWAMPDSDSQAVRFAVYRFPPGVPINLEDGAYILDLVYKDRHYLVRDHAAHPGARYLVTALDRLWNESTVSRILEAPAHPENPE